MSTIAPSVDLAASRLSSLDGQSIAKAAERRKLKDTTKDVSPEDRAAIRKLSEEFESMFLNMVMKSMRDTVPKNNLIDGGNAEEIYRSMLDSEYSKVLATQRRSGIADAVERQMLGIQQKMTKTLNHIEGNKAYGSESLRFDDKKAKIDVGL